MELEQLDAALKAHDLELVNKEAIIKAIYFGKAVNSSFENEVISWDRKHYEYPDKG